MQRFICVAAVIAVSCCGQPSTPSDTKDIEIQQSDANIAESTKRRVSGPIADIVRSDATMPEGMLLEIFDEAKPYLYERSHFDKVCGWRPMDGFELGDDLVKTNNPSFGYPRIADIANNSFSTDIEPDVVRRILAKHYKPKLGGEGPSWLTFIGMMKDSLWSMDLFVCESTILKTHWVLVVMDQYTRRIIGFAANEGPVDGPNLCRMFNEIISGKDLPKYISRDNDPLYRYHQWEANMRILKFFDDLKEIRSIPHVPTSHSFVERLIGSVRREFLNNTTFWNEVDLLRKLNIYKEFYNSGRVHRSLCGQFPTQWAGDQNVIRADFDEYFWKSWCRGLYKLPVAA